MKDEEQRVIPSEPPRGVFDALSAKGGMMRAGIPEFRLPNRILNEEIARIDKLGVQFELNQRLGKDFSFEDLSPYGAIFLSVGPFAGKPSELRGKELNGVLSGLEFLKNIKGKKRFKLGKRVVIIGGGNTAVDCARSALRMGTHAEVFYRRTKEEMPAFNDDIVEAEEEGVEFQFLLSPIRILGEGGRVKAVEFRRNKLGKKDPDGRRRFTAIRGSEFTINADAVILATGEISDLAVLSAHIVVEGNKVLAVDRRGATSLTGVFAGGDMIPQPHSVAHAVGSGKRAAIRIDILLMDGGRQKDLTAYERYAGEGAFTHVGSANKSDNGFRHFLYSGTKSFLRALVGYYGLGVGTAGASKITSTVPGKIDSTVTFAASISTVGSS